MTEALLPMRGSRASLVPRVDELPALSGEPATALASPVAVIPAPGRAGSPVEQRAALGQGVCSRPRCQIPFQTRRSGGRKQRFCTHRCRRLADAEFRRAARSTTHAPPPSPASIPRPPRRSPRERSAAYWQTGIDAATGRRVQVAIRPPAVMAEGGAGCQGRAP